MISLAAIYALFAALFAGLSQGFIKKPSELLGTSKVIFYRNLFVTVLSGLALLLFLNSTTFDLPNMCLAVLLAAASYLGLFFFFKALKYGRLSIVSPVASTALIFMVLTGVLFLGDTVNSTKILAVSMVLLGVVFLSINFRAFKESDLFTFKSGVPYAILAAIAWGITVPFFSIPSEKLGPILFTLVLESTIGIIAFVTIKVRGETTKLAGAELRLLPTLVLASTFGMFGSLLQNFAYSTKQIIVTATIIATQPLIVVLLGKFMHGDRLTKLQYLGALLAVLGGILITTAK